MYMYTSIHTHIISYPEGEFQVLSSPHLHPCVVRPQVMEVVLAHSKQTTCHSRRPEETKTHQTIISLQL